MGDRYEERSILRSDADHLQWQVAADCAGLGLWQIDKLNGRSFFSQNWYAMRGLRVDDSAATQFDNWIARIHPTDLETIKTQLAAEWNGGTDIVYHLYREKHAEGHWIWILSRGKIIQRDANGKALLTVGVDTDVTDSKRAEEKIATLVGDEHRWRVAVESAQQGLWDINHITGENYFPNTWRAMHGIAEDSDAVPDLEDWLNTVHPSDRPRLLKEFEDLKTSTGDHIYHEYRRKKPDGSWAWIMSRGKIVSREQGSDRQHLIGTDTDITELKKSGFEYRRLNHRYKMAISTAQLGVWEFDLTRNVAIWDDKTKALFGVDPLVETLPADAWSSFIHPDDRSEAVAKSDAAAQTQTSYAIDYRIVLASGEIRHIRSRAGFHYDLVKGPRMVGINWDVTEDYRQSAELKRAKELAENKSREIEAAQHRLKYNALHDALTGLPNRRHLDDTLELLTAHASPQDSTRVALLHIDLDRFKQVNDTMGHMAGDAILRHVATILNMEVPTNALVCRIGGDEFVVLLQNAPDKKAIAALASRLLAKMQEPVVIDGNECLYGASIGVAMREHGAIDGRTLLINADIALYRAKSDGRNRYSFFSLDMQEQVKAHKKCADDIRRGLERKEFLAVYQPQFDAKSRDVVGVEALVRWQHPERGLLFPHEFLGVAEEINAVAQIDAFILETALTDLAQWRAAGVCVPQVSVNVSAKRLGDPKLIESLSHLNIPVNSLSFELLESIYLDKQNETIASNLEALRQMGIGIEIDDFGTAQASIACLLSLRPNRMKIDRQLVQPIRVSVEQRRLLASIVDIGQALGIEVLAEGVETLEHARILQGLDCQYLQGFALAKPMSAVELSAFIRAEKWRVAA